MPRKNKEKEFIEVFISSLLEDAITSRASDIHIEPLAKEIRFRFRIDGKLQEKFSQHIEEHELIINKIKVLASLDITNRTTPQEGHFELIATPSDESPVPTLLSPTEGRPIDVRVSIFPTVYGEAAVLRLLNRAEMLIPLEELGMDANTLTRVKRLISKASGMLLVTGPAGSGKTTLLYSILTRLRAKEKNIITLEDPVELNLEGIRQSQMRPGQGLTFASAMRSVLRQDPDILMIGEIRDPETAQYATRASLTGRSVFSTVHSNSTIGTIARLFDMDVERSLIAYAINGIISKRLVRKICPHCQTPYNPLSEFLKFFNLEKADHQFIKGKGCDKCQGIGYFARTGLFEVLEFDDNLRAMIVDGASMDTLQEYAEKAGMKTLKQDAIEKVLANTTTLEEAIAAV